MDPTAPPKATADPKSEFTPRNIIGALIICGIAIAVVAVGKWLCDSVDSPSHSPGDIVTLCSQKNSDILGTPTDAEYDELEKYAEANDTPGVTQMIMRGACLEISCGTRARVLTYGHAGRAEVRMLDGTHSGESAIVIIENVR